MNILSNTLRNEIAECLQKAYRKVSINSATKMLNFNNTNEMHEFASKVNVIYIVIIHFKFKKLFFVIFRKIGFWVKMDIMYSNLKKKKK